MLIPLRWVDPENRAIGTVFLLLVLVTFSGCSKSPSEPVELGEAVTLQLESDDAKTIELRAAGDQVVRISAVQHGIDVSLRAVAGETAEAQTVDSPLQRNATEYLTFRVSGGELITITVAGVDEDYAQGSVDLTLHTLSEIDVADRELIAAELELTSTSLIDDQQIDWRQRADAYETLSHRFLELGLESRAADALMRAAMTRYSHLFQWRESANLAANAFRQFERLGDQRNGALALDLQGAALIELINDPDADTSQTRVQAETEAIFNAALGLLQDADDPYNRARVTNNIGLMHFYLGNYDQSREYYEQARALFAAISETKWEAITLQNLLLQDFELRRDVANAPTQYEQLLKLIDKDRNPDLYVDILNNAALANTILGNVTTAVAQFEEALALWSDHPGRGRIYAWLALAFLRGGDHEQAQVLLETAIPLHRQANDSRDLAASHRLLGNIYRRNGEFDKAIAAHQQSLAARKSGYRRVNVQLELARDHFAAGDIDATRRQVDEIEESAEFTAAPRISTGLLLLQARLAMANRESEAAENLIEESIELAQEFGLWDKLHEGYIALADSYEADGDSDAMRGALEHAINVLEDTRLRIGSPELRATLIAERGEAYDRLVGFYLNQHASIETEQETLKNEALEKALQTLHQSRSQVFMEQLRFGEDAEKTSTLLVSAMAKHERLVYEYATRGTEKAYLDTNMETIAKLAAGLVAESRGVSTRTREAVRIKSVQDRLDANEVIFNYWVSRAGSRLIVIRSDSVDAIEIANTTVLRKHAQELSTLLESPDSRLAEVYQKVARLREHVVPDDILRDDDFIVYIQPDDVLHTVPFHLLFGDGPAVVKVASAYPARYAEATAAGSESIVVAHNGPAELADDLPLTGRAGLLSSLPHIQDEVEAFTNYSDAMSTTILLNEEATKRSLLSYNGKRLKHLHIAAHALANPAMPGLSWIQLSDGKVFSAEIERSDLQADLVVLSACVTALGRNIPREGIFGLTRSFLISGADTVVASLWQVSDRATSALFSGFYYHHLSNGLNAAEALQKAYQKVRGNPRWRHPYYWSAFEIWQPDPFGNSK